MRWMLSAAFAGMPGFCGSSVSRNPGESALGVVASGLSRKLPLTRASTLLAGCVPHDSHAFDRDQGAARHHLIEDWAV
jgi:hypothetical protein